MCPNNVNTGGKAHVKSISIGHSKEISREYSRCAVSKKEMYIILGCPEYFVKKSTIHVLCQSYQDPLREVFWASLYVILCPSDVHSGGKADVNLISIGHFIENLLESILEARFPKKKMHNVGLSWTFCKMFKDTHVMPIMPAFTLKSFLGQFNFVMRPSNVHSGG